MERPRVERHLGSSASLALLLAPLRLPISVSHDSTSGKFRIRLSDGSPLPRIKYKVASSHFPNSLITIFYASMFLIHIDWDVLSLENLVDRVLLTLSETSFVIAIDSAIMFCSCRGHVSLIFIDRGLMAHRGQVDRSRVSFSHMQLPSRSQLWRTCLVPIVCGIPYFFQSLLFVF